MSQEAKSVEQPNPILSIEDTDIDYFAAFMEGKSKGVQGDVPIEALLKGGPDEPKKEEEGEIPDSVLFEMQDKLAEGADEPELDTKKKPAGSTEEPLKVVKKEEQPPADGDPADIVAQNIYEHFVDNGLFNKDETFDNTVDGLVSVMQKNTEAKAVEIAQGWISETFKANTPQAQKASMFFDHLRRGGNVDTFLEAYSGDSIDTEALNDDKDEDRQTLVAKMLVRQYYGSVLNHSDEAINSRIERWEKLGNLVEEAKTLVEPYNKYRETREQSAADQVKKQQEALAVTTNNLVKLINEKEEFAGYKIGAKKEEKQALISFFFTPSVELKDGRKVTPFIAEQIRLREDPEAMLFLALSSLNKKEPTELKEKAKEQAAKSLRDKIREGLKQVSKGRSNEVEVVSGRQTGKRDLGFDFENPLRR